MYTVIKVDYDDGSDCTLVGRYSFDIVPVWEEKSPGFIGTYEECQFFLDEIEQEEIAFHCKDLDVFKPHTRDFQS